MSILIALLIAAAPSLGLKIQREAEDRARADVTDLLRTLCPEQCVLLSVRAQTDDEDVGGEVSPGFDAPGNRTVPVLRLLNASLVVDQRLPAAFRTRVKALVGERLKMQGVPAEVALQQVNFPVRNPPYLEAPPQQPVPPPAPKAEPLAPPPVAASTPVAPIKLQDKLMEHAPLLAVIVLLGGVLLALGGLFYLAARKPSDSFMPEGLPLDAPPQ